MHLAAIDRWLDPPTPRVCKACRREEAEAGKKLCADCEWERGHLRFERARDEALEEMGPDD